MPIARVTAWMFVFAVLGGTLWFTMEGYSPSAGEAASDILETDEYERLKAIELIFEKHEGEFHTYDAGLGEHEGGKPPVTPHPNPPAFGESMKVVMTDAEFFQFYQAYQSPKHPVFVTSDSLIQAYFAVLRAALVRAEAVEAWDLRDTVVEGLKKLDAIEAAGSKEVVESSRRLARINLAIVARLFSSKSPALANADEEMTVKEEVARIEAAKETQLPTWLHRPEDDEFAIDYRMFQAVGERRSQWSKRRFRALKWLSVLPWRIDRDEHLLATLLAARATETPKKGTALKDQVGTLLMPPDDLDAAQLLEWHGAGPLDVAKFAKIRDAVAKKFAVDPPRLNDQIRFPPDKPIHYARWRSGGRGADLVALKQLFGERPFNGLGLCASLGSPFARSKLGAADWSRVPSPTQGDTLGSEWWKAAALLLQPPPKNAPAFMEHVEWQIKSCQTVLGGWVQWRVATEVFRKSEMWCMNEGADLKFRGAVEPNPEFFRKLELLAKRTGEELERRQVFRSAPRRCAALIPDQLSAVNEQKRIRSRVGERNEQVEARIARMAAIPLWFHTKIETANKGDAQDAVAAALVQFWEAANDNRWPADANATKLMKLLDEPTERRLKDIALLANRCAELAEKQLAGKPFTDADDRWLLHYGRRLAGIAGYIADADESPADDSARIAEATYDPRDSTFHTIAVGRPRALWVLYPHQGTEVVCRGAVYPYYEFSAPEKPNEQKWQQTVRDKKQPEQPAWIKPIQRVGGKG